MLLRSTRVENFRSVRCARISFDAVTVFIGENDCGRSSIMEAVALAMGWNAKEGEFQFQRFHFHRAADGEAPSETQPDCLADALERAAAGSPVTPQDRFTGPMEQAAPPEAPCRPEKASAPISIVLEFGESSAGEWDGDGFEILRAAWPEVLKRDRRFWLEVTHSPDTGTRWRFRAGAAAPLLDERWILAWLRRRMPVAWMIEGMVAGSRGAIGPSPLARTAGGLADEVSRHYRELLQGTAMDVTAAIEGGSAAARELLLNHAKLRPSRATPVNEILEEITGRETPQLCGLSSAELVSSGTAAHKVGLLLLVGALLRAGAGRVERGMDPLTIIENPEAHLHPMTLASIWGVIERIGGQKIIGTHSGTLLSYARLSSFRRLTRHDGVVTEWRVPDGTLNADELRRYSYHLRSRRAGASFARCWLLVEGETEYWLLGELARICGYDFATEGVACVEFAQCGLAALTKVAQRLGIDWHLLADGDAAGQQYALTARQCAGPDGEQGRITVLREPDVEHCFWRYGYQNVFRMAASAVTQRHVSAKAVIRRAIERHSKPYIAVLLLDEAIGRGREGVPPPLRRAIETCIQLARSGPAKAHSANA